MIVGATWTQSSCATSTPWTTAGGTVAAAVSGQASTSGVPVGGLVTWDSAAHPGMNADVQGWLDSPASDHGWRITSDTEGVTAEAQRFVSTEGGAGAPALTIIYSCKPGFQASGNDCVAVMTAPALGPVATSVLLLLLCAVPFLSRRLAS